MNGRDILEYIKQNLHYARIGVAPVLVLTGILNFSICGTIAILVGVLLGYYDFFEDKVIERLL